MCYTGTFLVFVPVWAIWYKTSAAHVKSTNRKLFGRLCSFLYCDKATGWSRDVLLCATRVSYSYKKFLRFYFDNRATGFQNKELLVAAPCTRNGIGFTAFWT